MDYYTVSRSIKVQDAEKDLNKEIVELQNEIDEATLKNDGDPSKHLNTISPPANPDYFKKEREVAINSLISCSNGSDVRSLSDVYTRELLVSKSTEFTEASLPLLLLQFYLDRMTSLTQCKHLHMLRWRRFSEHTEAIERLLSSYTIRLDLINKEYNDAKETARRLSSSHSNYVTTGDVTSAASFSAVRPQDLKTFTTWLICQGQSVRKITTYCNVIKWISIKYKDFFTDDQKDDTMNNDVINTTDDNIQHYDVTNSLTTSSSLSLVDNHQDRTSRLKRKFSALAIATPSIFSGFVTNISDIDGPPHYTLELHEFRQHLESLVQEYGIIFKSTLQTSSDEMELFGAVNRRFKLLFNHQQQCNTFYQYDNAPKEHSDWGVKGASQCLLKSSPWVKHIQIKPHLNTTQLKQMTWLKQHGKIDELLYSQNNFIKKGNYSVVTESLKLHSSAVKNKPPVQSLSVTSNPKGSFKTAEVWDRIYKTSKKKQLEDDEDRKEILKDENLKSTSTIGNEYDYSSTMQMFGLDEGDDTTGSANNHDQDNQQNNNIQGAYLSYLHLRHLKIRDLRRQVLQILNYFRSIERTITIFDCGYSLECSTDDTTSVISKSSKRSHTGGATGNKQSRKATSRNKTRPKKQQQKQSNNNKKTGNHHHVFNIPADFKVEQDRFMSYTGVENHDDFYSFDYTSDNSAPPTSDGEAWRNRRRSTITSQSQSRDVCGEEIPQIQDYNGLYVVYDEAVKDFNQIEDEVLLVASHYIGSYQDGKKPKKTMLDFNVDIPIDSRRDIDRFAVLNDIWLCELNYHINKRKVLDLLVESYQNTFDAQERRKLAQLITDTIYRRPRHDFTASYFVQLYQNECVCLRQKSTLLTKILVNHIEEQRQFINRSCRSKYKPGMPFFIAPKQEISPNLPVPSIKHVDILEFHGYLGSVAIRACQALDYLIHDVVKMYGGRDNNNNKICLMEKIVYQLADEEWEDINRIGSSYHPQFHKDIYSTPFIDDPLLINETLDSICNKPGSTPQNIQIKEINTWKRTAELCLLRHRLVDVALETETLNSLYKQIGKTMNYDEFHASLRILAFEYAKVKEVNEQPTSSESFLIDEKKLDRYLPQNLSLSINELDETHIPKFSFRNRENFLQILEDTSRIEDIKLTLCYQVITRNLFSTAIRQATYSIKMDELDVVKKLKEMRIKAEEKEKLANENNNGVDLNETSEKSKEEKEETVNSEMFVKKSKKNIAFISVQQEKLEPRNIMTNSFLKHKNTLVGGMNIEELIVAKRKLINQYLEKLNHRLGLHAKREQIISHYTSIVDILQSFPQTLSNYFIIGSPFEAKSPQDSPEGMKVEFRRFHKRPRRVISEDGKSFMNIWFIPHYTEVISSFRHLKYQTQHSILTSWLTIVESLHEIIQFICARCRLNDCNFINAYKGATAADWGGIQGINSELKEIQIQIDSLPNVNEKLNHCKNPSQVAELIQLRKKSTLLEFRTTVLDSMSETFLATGNSRGWNNLMNNSNHAFRILNDEDQEESCSLIQLRIPQSLLKKDEEKSNQLFPWLSFNSSNGFYPTSYKQDWNDIETCIQLCFASLDDNDKKCANAELLSVGLLLDDILQQGLRPIMAIDNDDSTEFSDFYSNETEDEADESSKGNDILTKPISKTNNPILAYKVIIKFLRLTRQLNITKYDWAETRLQINQVDSLKHYRSFVRTFQNEIVLPAYCSMARQTGGNNNNQYENVTTDDQILPLPKGVADATVRANLLTRLLETKELQLISELRQRISKDFTNFMSEQSRSDEAVLPLDLWQQQNKQPQDGAREESLVVSTPQLYQEFLQRLMSDASTSKDQNGANVVSFGEDHLKMSLSKLASAIIVREKDNYETYSTFYENLLQHQTQLLYKKELQMKSQEIKQNSSQDQQFQLADRSHELILEVTSLRAKVLQLESEMKQLEIVVREDERSNCQELIRELFQSCFEMKMKLADYHLQIHNDMRMMVGNTRNEAMLALEKLRDQLPTSTAEERLVTIRNKEKQLEELEQDKHDLNILFNKFKTFVHMQKTTSKTKYKSSMEKMRHSIAVTKREYITREALLREENALLREELASARKSLQQSKHQLEETYEEININNKIAQEKTHIENLDKQNRLQLHQAQQRKMKRLLIELQQKDVRLRNLSNEVEKNNVVNNITRNRIHKNLQDMERKVQKERGLKLDALEQVDELQSAILYTEHQNNNGSSNELRRPKTSHIRLSTRTEIRPLTSETSSSLVRIRSNYTPAPLPKKRPYTAGNTLRDRIAATLLFDPQQIKLPDHLTQS